MLGIGQLEQFDVHFDARKRQKQNMEKEKKFNITYEQFKQEMVRAGKRFSREKFRLKYDDESRQHKKLWQILKKNNLDDVQRAEYFIEKNSPMTLCYNRARKSKHKKMEEQTEKAIELVLRIGRLRKLEETIDAKVSDVSELTEARVKQEQQLNETVKHLMVQIEEQIWHL